MRSFGARQRIIVTFVLLALALSLSVDSVAAWKLARPTSAAAAQFAQDAEHPALLLSAVQLADRVRYAVTVLRPTAASLSNLKVSVTLPANAEVVDTLQTAGRTVFLGDTDGVLNWAAPGYEADEPADAFTFSLHQAAGGPIGVKASWTDDSGASAEQDVSATPTVVAVTATEADVTLTGADASGGLVMVGDTGVQLQVVSGTVPDGTVLHIRRPGAGENPPAGVGTPWWCAELSVDGLPEGAAVAVVVPTRQPLPAGQPVDLFGDAGNGWQALQEQGQASPDGQFVRFTHHGGIIAAGTSPKSQSTTATTTPASLTVNVTGTILLRNFTNGTWIIVVKNVGTSAAQRVDVTLSDAAHLANYNLSIGAIDYHSMALLSTPGGFTCSIVQGSAVFHSKAECSGPTLGGGQQIKIQLNGGIGFTVQHDDTVEVKAVNNFPNPPTTSASTPYESFLVALNP
jgi:hypothetical protein